MHHLSSFLAEFRNGFQQGIRFEVQVYPPTGLIDALLTGNPILKLVDIFLPTIGQQLDTTFSAPTVVNWLTRGLVCESASLPGRSFDMTDMTMYGYTEKFPVHTDFSGLTCTFRMPLVGSDNGVPRFFNYWLNWIQHGQSDVSDGMDFMFPDEYYGTVMVSTFDRQGHASGTYKFERAFPHRIHSTNVSWEGGHGGGFLTQSVDFQYSYWTLMPYTPPPLIEIDLGY